MHLIFIFLHLIKLTMETKLKGIKTKIMGREKRNTEDKGFQPSFGNCTGGN